MLPNIETILAATQAIRGALREYTDGWANTVARREIEKELTKLRYAAGGYFSEKVVSLSGWIDILYSARKHEKHGGTSAVRVYILGDLSAIENYVNRHTTAEE